MELLRLLIFVAALQILIGLHLIWWGCSLCWKYNFCSKFDDIFIIVIKL